MTIKTLELNLFRCVGLYNCVKKLLANGAYLGIKDNNGRTPYENSVSYRELKPTNYFQPKLNQKLSLFARLSEYKRVNERSQIKK